MKMKQAMLLCVLLFNLILSIPLFSEVKTPTFKGDFTFTSGINSDFLVKNGKIYFRLGGDTNYGSSYNYKIVNINNSEMGWIMTWKSLGKYWKLILTSVDDPTNSIILLHEEDFVVKGLNK
jgi:hypothetical protein